MPQPDQSQFAQEFAQARINLIRSARQFQLALQIYEMPDLETQVMESMEYLASSLASLETTAKVAASRAETYRAAVQHVGHIRDRDLAAGAR